MNVSGGFVWAGIVLLAFTSYVLGYTFISMERLELGKKIIGLVPLNFYLNRSLINCLGECLSRQHCRAISYHRMATMCLLFDLTPTDLEVEHDPSFITTRHITEWSEDIIDPCRQDTCPPWSQCVVHKNGTTACVISECQGDVADDSVHHSIVHRGAGTGYATFSCRGSRTLTGSAYRACGLDGEWSPPTYRCAFSPEVTMENKSYVVLTGHNVTIACHVTAVPDSFNVYWTFRESAGLSKNMLNMTVERFHGGTVNESSLTIIEVTTADTGNYTCNAENQEGLGIGEEIYLVVNGVKPTIRTMKRAYRTTNYKTITVKVTVTSDLPLTSVFWRFRSLETGHNKKVRIDDYYFSGANLTHPSLTINNASTWASGHYKSVVENAQGKSFGWTQSLHIKNLGPVVKNGPNTWAKVGSTVTLLCSVDPTPHRVMWLKSRNYTLPNSLDWESDRFSGSTNVHPSLTITKFMFSDQGLYWCTATGSDGNTAMADGIRLHVNN